MHKYYEWHWQSSCFRTASPGPFLPATHTTGRTMNIRTQSFTSLSQAFTSTLLSMKPADTRTLPSAPLQPCVRSKPLTRWNPGCVSFLEKLSPFQNRVSLKMMLLCWWHWRCWLMHKTALVTCLWRGMTFQIKLWFESQFYFLSVTMVWKIGFGLRTFNCFPPKCLN